MFIYTGAEGVSNTMQGDGSGQGSVYMLASRLTDMSMIGSQYLSAGMRVSDRHALSEKVSWLMFHVCW